jgi:hypothetical protein
MAFILGDCIHSLRASLDNMIWLLRDEKAGDRADLKQICFKVADIDSNDGPEHEWLSWRGRRASRVIPSVVLDEMYKFQPHVTGRNELTFLDNLWNGDKHRAPHVAVQTVKSLQMRFRVEAPHTFSMADDISPPRSGPFDDGDVVQRLSGYAALDPNLNASVACEPCFDALGPGRGETLWPLLVRMEDYVRDKVIPAFEHL